jgi:hypothetical protein
VGRQQREQASQKRDRQIPLVRSESATVLFEPEPLDYVGRELVLETLPLHFGMDGKPNGVCNGTPGHETAVGTLSRMQDADERSVALGDKARHRVLRVMIKGFRHPYRISIRLSWL